MAEVVQANDSLEAGARMCDGRVQLGLLCGGGLLVRVGDRELAEIDKEVMVAETVSDEILESVSKASWTISREISLDLQLEGKHNLGRREATW